MFIPLPIVKFSLFLFLFTLWVMARHGTSLPSAQRRCGADNNNNKRATARQGKNCVAQSDAVSRYDPSTQKFLNIDFIEYSACLFL